MQAKIEKIINDFNPEVCEKDRNLAIKLLGQYWDCLGEEITAMVANKHKFPQTTQNYYGSYIEILSFLKDCKIGLAMAGLILILAGAKIEGVKSAIKIMKGL